MACSSECRTIPTAKTVSMWRRPNEAKVVPDKETKIKHQNNSTRPWLAPEGIKAQRLKRVFTKSRRFRRYRCVDLSEMRRWSQGDCLYRGSGGHRQDPAAFTGQGSIATTAGIAACSAGLAASRLVWIGNPLPSLMDFCNRIDQVAGFLVDWWTLRAWKKPKSTDSGGKFRVLN